MQIFNIENDIPVFAMQVATFPLGISEAFDKLVAIGGGVGTRGYYGISFMNSNGGIVYKAAAQELEPGELVKFNCEQTTVPKGKYMVQPLYAWKSKTDKIKDVFEKMMQHSNANLEKPCIEWYKSDTEMWCMIQAK